MLPGRSCSKTKNMRSYRSHTASETKTVTIEPGCEDTMVCAWARASVKCRVWEQLGSVPYAWRAKIAGKKNRDPPHPDRSGARPARCWSLRDGHGERRTAGPLQPRAGPCRRSEAAESRCRMAAAHGASKTPVAVHEGLSAARSQELARLTKDSSRQQQNRTQVWIRETKVWGRRYGRGMESEV